MLDLVPAGAPLTDYEFGLERLPPMRIHPALDPASGAFPALSPRLFGFAS